MTRMIFVNLPVTDLARSRRFYEAVGATVIPEFTDDTAACMVVSDAIHVMLLTHDKWRQFTDRRIPGRDTAEVMLCLSCEGRDEVDAFVAKAGAAGGVVDPTPVQDYGFLYGRSAEDPDGHIWEVMWMDVDAPRAAMSAPAEHAAA